MRKIIIFLAVLLTLSFLSATNYYKINSCVDINIISNASSINISSLEYPNSSIAIKDKNITKTGIHLFSYSFCNTTDIGIYNYGYYDEAGNTYYDFFIINYTGTEFTTAQAILYIIFLAGAIFLFVLMIVGAVRFPWKNNRGNEGEIISINNFKYVKILFIALSYVALMFIFGLLRGITAFYIPEIGVDKLFNWVYWLMLSFLWPLIIIFFVIGIVNYLTDKKLMKALARGVPFR